MKPISLALACLIITGPQCAPQPVGTLHVPAVASQRATPPAFRVHDEDIRLELSARGLLEAQFDYSYANWDTLVVYVPVCGTPFPPILEKKGG
jgi:hypothetical protein